MKDQWLIAEFSVDSTYGVVEEPIIAKGVKRKIINHFYTFKIA